jgi:hypothetical protein
MSFPVFLGILGSLIGTAALVGFLFARGGDAHH